MMARQTWAAGLALAALTLGAGRAGDGDAVRVEVPVAAVGDAPAGANLNDLVARLAAATGAAVDRPVGDVILPTLGLAGNLTRTMLNSTLGPEASVTLGPKSLVVSVDASAFAPARKAEWEGRLRDLAGHAERESARRRRYGMRALASYRANDPGRPTVCLVHGMNSSSGGFVHMIRPIEEAGYGVVVYDYPYNRGIEASSRTFAEAWARFRRKAGETRPWAVVAHSMGALVARSYVEGPGYGGDVLTLGLLAPVNRGSNLAKTQTILQLLNGVQAVGGRRASADALAHLGDGLGEAASDMTPGSPFLKALNARPRRAGVGYFVIAGDVGFLARAARLQIESRVDAARRQSGLLGGLTRLATGNDLSDRLDEVTDGTGDGCVSVARTRLDGVTDHVTIHANHAELIRAPLLFRDPGPVACMPDLLRRLPRPAATR